VRAGGPPAQGAARDREARVGARYKHEAWHGVGVSLAHQHRSLGSARHCSSKLSPAPSPCRSAPDTSGAGCSGVLGAEVRPPLHTRPLRAKLC
jgi:hypothetical protein